MLRSSRNIALQFAVVAVLAGCATETTTTIDSTPHVGSSSPGSGEVVLIGSSWQLTSILLKEDGQDARKVSDPTLYTMTFAADGRANFRLNCNRASAPWKAAASEPVSGVLSFGPLSGTRAFCPQPSYDQLLMRDLPAVRSFLIRAGQLHTILAGDGGRYVWVRMKPPQ